MKTQTVNAQVLLETVLCVVFGALTLYLVASGKYLTYVAPRMKPYLYLSAAVMLVFALANFRRMRRPQHIVRAMHCLVLAVPILLLLLPLRPMNASNLSAGFAGSGVGGASATLPSGGSVAASGYQAENQQEGVGGTLPNEPVLLTDLPGFDPVNRRIDVPNDSFYEWLAEMFSNFDAYEGYTVSLTGYVLKDPEFLAENQFVPARLAMTCCVADLVPIGIVCQYEDAASLVENEWVKVEGELLLGELSGENEPQLFITTIEPAEPVEGYVYTY